MKDHRLRPGRKVRLARIDPRDTGKIGEEEANLKRERDSEKLARLQDLLYAEHRRALLIVLQGMDTAGKDGTIAHVMHGVNPSGCEVVPFKVPTEEESAHDFLWRVHRATPRRGHITIFNRSHYEDVIVPRVHRTLPDEVIERRFDAINDFERLLVENDTVILKFFLHVSKREQAERLRARLQDPTKRWKFSAGDLVERKLWPRYTAAYEDLLERTTTKRAPWFVVPADHKWYRNLVVARAIVETLDDMRPQYPKPHLSPAQLRKFEHEL